MPINTQVVNQKLELEKIEDAVKNEPVFHFLDELIVDSNWCSNVRSPVQTTIGNLIFNLCSIVPCFNNKMDFILGRISVSKIENEVAAKLKDDLEEGEIEDQKVYYVKEYLAFVNSLQYITEFSQLCITSATEKNIQTAPGLKEYRAKLLDEYKGRLDDLTVLKELEQKLVDYDNKYLEGDPSNGIFLSGKSKDVSRKKLFIMIGTETGFSGGQDIKAINTSLSDGWPTDPEAYTAMLNGSRAGSYSRGAETIKGGVAAKVLLRSGSNFLIVDTDCNTISGFTRYFSNYTKSQLLGRYIKNGTKWEEITSLDQTTAYIGKPVVMRSPMYCKLDGDRICKICAGAQLSQMPSGLTIPLTDISATILTTSLKAMHGKALLTADLDMSKVFS